MLCYTDKQTNQQTSFIALQLQIVYSFKTGSLISCKFSSRGNIFSLVLFFLKITKSVALPKPEHTISSSLTSVIF